MLCDPLCPPGHAGRGSAWLCFRASSGTRAVGWLPSSLGGQLPLTPTLGCPSAPQGAPVSPTPSPQDLGRAWGPPHCQTVVLPAKPSRHLTLPPSNPPLLTTPPFPPDPTAAARTTKDTDTAKTCLAPGWWRAGLGCQHGGGHGWGARWAPRVADAPVATGMEPGNGATNRGDALGRMDQGTAPRAPGLHLPFAHPSHPLFGHMFWAGPPCPCTPRPLAPHAPQVLFPATLQPLDLVGM